MDDPRRLARLATAQGKLAMALEASLVRREREIAALVAAREALMRALDGGHALGIAVGGAGLRRILQSGREISEASSTRDELRHRLLAARARENVLAGNADRLRAVLARKADEAEALEAALMRGRKPPASLP
jgi:hypothetical protein